MTAAGPKPFTIRHETIKVSGGAPVEMDVRETIHGPILNDVEPRLKDAPPMALRWTSLQVPDHTVESVLRLATVGDFTAFRSALSTYTAPAQNFVYADVDGHIGYQFPGAMPDPLRPGRHGAATRIGRGRPPRMDGLRPVR